MTETKGKFFRSMTALTGIETQRMVGVTQEHVRWAYRLLLDREPEDEDWVKTVASSVHSTVELRRNFLSSPEYRLKNRGVVPLAGAQTVVIAEMADGLRIFLDLADSTISLNVLRGTYEIDELAWVKGLLKHGDTAVDLGANLGVFSLHMASWVGDEGVVYAFEPLSSNVELLRRSVAENGLESSIVVTPAAVAEKKGRTSFLYLMEGSSSGGSHLVADGTTAPPGHGTEEVAVVTLDECDLRRPVRFIKMDIEGAEPLACRGAERILAEDCPTILSEINPVQLEKVSDCNSAGFIEEMKERGYRCYLLESGEVGRRIEAASSLCSVVFLPGDQV